ncbi:MAG: hypothetical protein J6Y65_03060, partial [Eggerthellaceae bacterium]|nr:hypothetical protein [Eggerthellaceae bacterium]
PYRQLRGYAMNLYINEKDQTTAKKYALEDMILTIDLPTTCGSKMLEGYKSLFEASVVADMEKCGYALAGKVNVGEFGFDLIGETSCFGECVDSSGNLVSASALLLEQKEAEAIIGVDVNGTQRRAAAQTKHICFKPTYGVVSRYGIVQTACSGETVCISANGISQIKEAFETIAGHDDKDGTSLPQNLCDKAKDMSCAKAIKKVALISNMFDGVDDGIRAKANTFVSSLKQNGIETVEVTSEVMGVAGYAWNILMAAEICNNVSRFDGVKYGYRSNNYETIDELYTASRTEAFGDVTKATVLFGSEVLATDNYEKMYDKSLRIRRLVVEEFNRLFETFDAVLIPACSRMAYTPQDIKQDKYLCFSENKYSAPSSISGLPTVALQGIQVIAPALSDTSLLSLVGQCMPSEGGERA